MLRSVRIRSLKDTSLRLGTPVFLVLMGLVVCLLWGVWENRKLADKYIADTAKLYVDQINRDMSQINSELIYLLDSDSNIKEIPDQITSTDAQYYEMEQTLRERNRVLKIRYHEIQTFFVYGHRHFDLHLHRGVRIIEFFFSRLDHSCRASGFHRQKACKDRCHLLGFTAKCSAHVHWVDHNSVQCDPASLRNIMTQAMPCLGAAVNR